jgi:acetyltransferase-like isoleucine patch superfamily enzyme
MRYFFIFERRFYQYLILRIEGFLKGIINEYKRSPRLPPRLKHLTLRRDLIVNSPERLFISKSVSIGEAVKFTAPDNLASADPAKIVISDGVFIGQGVELGLAPFATLSIGSNTSMHEGTVILGNVQIGSNCIFSYNIFIASGNHVIAERPTWLIRDQDDAFLAGRPLERVIIEDDVWIGWGVFVKSGVTVGKGAVIGANAVVTKDLEPYAIYGGSPAHLISRRLDFAPPTSVNALSDDCVPYFYSGFLCDQRSLRESRSRNVIWANQNARIILRHDSPRKLTIRGALKHIDQTPIEVNVSINGFPIGKFQAGKQPFAHSFELPEVTPWSKLKMKTFEKYLEIGLQYSSHPVFCIGLEEVTLDSN